MASSQASTYPEQHPLFESHDSYHISPLLPIASRHQLSTGQSTIYTDSGHQTTSSSLPHVGITQTKSADLSIQRSTSPDNQEFQENSASRPVDFNVNSSAEILDVKTHVMCNWLYQQQQGRMWSSGGTEEGVMVKKARGEYICCPPDLQLRRDGFFDAVKALNVRCAMTVNTNVIQLLMQREENTYVPLENGLRVQILADIQYLPRSQKHHFAAFIQNPSILVVWDDDPNHILQRVQKLELELMNTIWNQSEIKEKSSARTGNNMAEDTPQMLCTDAEANPDFLDERLTPSSRPIVLIQPVLTAITLVLVFLAIGAGWRRIAIELKVDKGWIRLAFAFVAPLQCWLALFFMQSLVFGVVQMIGPVNQMASNTRFFSGQAPPRLYRTSLPHVTILCPVYKEGLWPVIDPTVRSVKAAISTYEMQGGTANIFINDDGMQVISARDAQERRDYYDEHNIGWVARPAHNQNPLDGGKEFIRAGKFKKASNMNYGLNISTRVEDKLSQTQRHTSTMWDWEADAYETTLAQVIEEDQGRTLAGGNIRVGDYILVVDSDTRVPTDCFLDAVSEMEFSPEVALIQFSSGVMNVTTSWFEKGVTFFTNLIYTAISYTVSNGDVAPFVGHNAFLRWSAVQDVSYLSNDGQAEQYWSESTVSEDLDLSLRLQTSGYILRFANYTGSEFKEGVSLNVYDELARWEKYTYGCAELIFHPLSQWWAKGPFTPLFRRFLWSSIPLHSKLTIMAYVGTYFAIASAWILAVLNYFMVGWFNGHLDHYYVDSFKIYFSVIVVFSALGNVGLGVLRYRVEDRTLAGALLENFTWTPLLTIYLGGISLHLSQAILCHLFGVDMTWGATLKEAKDTSFFAEVPVILRKFRVTFGWTIGMGICMVIMAGVGPFGQLVPHDWQIRIFIAIWPLGSVLASHFLLPLVLNPGLMQFTF